MTLAILIPFQNCTKANFSSPEMAELASLGFSVGNATASTQKNTPVEFPVVYSGPRTGSLSFNGSAVARTARGSNGSFQILDAATGKLKYTPDANFVGEDKLAIFLFRSDGTAVQGEIKVTVGNIFHTLRPALAVRGNSCVACHAKVNSDVITDFGFGNSFFFNAPSTVDRGFYGDHGFAYRTMQVSPEARVIVPKITFPAALATSTGATSLSDYLVRQFTVAGAKTSPSQVREVNTVQIKLPNAARIRQAFGNATGSYKYEPDTHLSPALTGLTEDAATKSFRITDLVCDGDLFLDGTVLMDNATIASVNGCRIYTTGSVFVQKKLVSAAHANSTNHNIQLISARGIFIGLGGMFNAGVKCETAWPDSRNVNSLEERLRHMVSHNAQMRESTAADFKTATLNDSAIFPNRLDASCEAAGRGVALERVLLAAPAVHSRFTGQVRGTVIAEVALMALGAFDFQFDPIFSAVSTFPKLAQDELLKVD